MGKAVSKVAGVVAAVALVATGVGAIGGLALFGTTVGISIAGLSLGTLLTIGAVAGSVQALFAKRPKVPEAARDRLFATLVPDAPRKMVFGRTALATDVRYQSYTGTDQEYYHQIVCVASHAVEAIEEIWFDNEQAWTASGGVASKFTGYLTVATRLEGTSSNGIAIDAKWTSNCRLTGCAYLHLRYKLTGNSKKAESPFSAGISSRMTIVGEGAAVYDPRLDTTEGGSRAHRADDQSTWAYNDGTDDIGRNPALVLLWYLLGWRINDLLAVGRGVPPERINLASFIDAANLCDESVTLSAGGTEPRYRFDGIFSEADDGQTVIDGLLASMNAVLRDDGGRLSLSVLYNDLATPVTTFTEDDVLGAFNWLQTPSIGEDRNIARGRYTSADTKALYQMVDYPAVGFSSPDGIDRILSLDLAGVQSPGQAQRLAKQQLQRLQYGGVFTAEMGARAWGVRIGDPVAFDFYPLGFEGKLFRVGTRMVSYDGRCQMTLVEENEDLYAWDAEDAAAVEPADPTIYDYLNNPMLLGALSELDEAAADKLAGIEEEADVTANAVPDLQVPGSIEIAADSSGATTTSLPLTRRCKGLKGGVDLSPTSNFVATFPTGITGSINNTASSSDRGVITITDADSSGNITVTATPPNSAPVTKQIPVNRTLAPPTQSGGGGGETVSVSDSSWFGISSGSHVAVTDVLTIAANAAGELTYTAYSEYVPSAGTNHIVAIKAQYRLTSVGGAFSDFAAESVGTATGTDPDFGGPTPGVAMIAAATKTGLTASTDYDVQLVARRTNGANPITFSNSSFSVYQ